MTEVERVLSEVKIPRMARIAQHFDRPTVEPRDIPAKVRGELARAGALNVSAGSRIAITAGSREVANMPAILAAAVASLREVGADPFIVPAMGSHGGATAEGQTALLARLGITESSVGAPIVSSMETVRVGTVNGDRPVCADRAACEADGIVVIGRVKAHTDFRGTYESGIMKMLAIGLGKREGADSCHSEGFGRMAENVPLFGAAVLRGTNVIGALALIENAYDETADIVGLTPDEIADREPQLLVRAKELMPRIMIPECDVLVVDEIGKNYSGTGMDPNVSGRHNTPYSHGGVKSQRVAVLGLSRETHGNGFGIGSADTTTKRTAAALDIDAMTINSLTSTVISLSSVPAAFDSDRLAIQACIKTCIGLGPDGPRLIRIPNTLHVGEIWISENMIPEAERIPNIELLSPPEEMPFDEEGFLGRGPLPPLAVI